MQQAADSVRLFFALWPDSPLQTKLAAWANQAAGNGRPTRRENIHLTLAFLGATDAALLPLLIDTARALRFAPFPMIFDRVGYWKHNRIIWCGTENVPPALNRLVASLRTSLEHAGIGFDPKPYVPHITLVRKSPGIGVAPYWVPLEWTVRDFALMRSVPAKSGVRYEVLQRFAAQAAS